MDTVIIKLYTNNQLDEYHDLCINEFENILGEMKKYAKEHGKTLCFAAIGNSGFPIDNDCFAEVEYTGDMQDTEKKYYLETLNELATDAEISVGEMDIFNTLRFVRFRKITDEIITL